MKLNPSLIAPALLALTLSACSSGGGSDKAPATGTAATTGSASIVLGTAGDAGLFSMTGVLEELRLVRSDGTTTENLMASAMTLELVGLDDGAEWVAQADLEPGSYTAIEFAFDKDSLQGMDMTGSRVPITMSTATHTAELDSTLDVSAGSESQLYFEIDLSTSVSGTATSPPLEFLPEVTIFVDEPQSMQMVHGTVIDSSRRKRSIVLEAEGRNGVALGRLEIQITDDTVMVDVDGTEFLFEAAFFRSLRDDLTMLEVRGSLVRGSVLVASKVRIVDHAGAMPPVVEIEGMVIWVDQRDQYFVLLMREIEKGKRIAKPVLEALGSPRTLEVEFDADTRFELAGGRQVLAQQLAPGHVVDVEFGTFSGPPFVADVVELERPGVCFTARISDVSGLPDSMVVRLDHRPVFAPAGNFFPKSIEVEVDLTDAELRLAFRRDPILRPQQLLEGVNVRLCGRFGGTRAEPTFDARRVFVRAGRIDDGHLASIDPASSSFVLDDGELEQTFGIAVTSPPFSVVIHPSAHFEGEVRSESEFFRLFNSVGTSVAHEIRVRGIGSGARQEVVAYEVMVKLRQ